MESVKAARQVVRTVNDDHKPINSIGQRDQVIQELDPRTIAVRRMLKSQ
jgi:hypothetical protein